MGKDRKRIKVVKLKKNNNIKKFGRRMIPGIIAAGVYEINLLVDTIFASRVDGAISWLYYSSRLIQLPIALVGISIGTVLLPTLSRVIKSGNKKETENLYNEAFVLGQLFTIPSLIGFLSLGTLIVATLFERGEFLRSDTIEVVSVLKYYVLGLPFIISNVIMGKVFFAHEDTKTPVKFGVFSVTINIILNYILFQFMSYRGIALSLSIATFITSVLIHRFVFFKRKWVTLRKDSLVKLFKIIISSIIMYTFIYCLAPYIEGINKYIELIILVGGAGFVYLISILTFKVFDVRKILP